ncbi:AAA family ATPase [Bacillus sp. JJ1562]|uniref:AAA family ATPase n=1 Tax=Bacillus sp. JJ1562 TaxID=3122960 RepID=UPI003001865E
MKIIALLQLSLINFKGVKNFVLDTRGENVKVFGDNATGKTTIFDGFVWLLFDKDSNNKKDFAIKTLDKAGKVLHHLDHQVEAIFFVDGNELTLKKSYSEKWTKKRGSIHQEFSGHTTDYFIDGIPAKKKEYDELISGLINEDVFKLLTSPSYFNEQLKWQDRRKVLLDISGDIADEEVIASNKDLAKLMDVLNGRSIENHRKVIAARRTEINKELEKIPVRIDELHRSLPDLTGIEREKLEAEINRINSEIDGEMTLINNIRNGNAISQKQREIQEIEIELLRIKQEHEAGSKDDVYRLKAKIQEENSNVSLLNSRLENIKNNKRYNDDNINRIEEELVKLREEWTVVDSSIFVHKDDCSCPTCGQDLPEEQVTAARDKALSQFNLEKSTKLENINKRGQQGKLRKEEILAANEKLLNEYDNTKVYITEKQKVVEILQEQLLTLESTIVDITENPVYVSKLNEKQQLMKQMNELKLSADESIQDIQMAIYQLKQERDDLQKELAKFGQNELAVKRISELQEQEEKLAEEFEKLEHELYLTEEFIRTKVNLLEDKINSKFKYARFKLFETQINGGLQEVCETLYNGVPYGSGLNNAAKINVGLDIINTLSEHYGFMAPIFVDNSEAVTKLIDVDAQVISLVVSEKDKVLRVESPKQLNREAV